MTFTMEIDSENDAMRTADDVSRALSKLATHLRGRDWDDFEGKIRDDNGNTVGSWNLSGAGACEDEE